MVVASLNQLRQHGQYFWLVVQPEGEQATWEKFEAIEEMIDRIKSLDGEDVSVCPMLGLRMGVSAGPLRYLATPLGYVPMFKLPSPEEMESTDGYLGKRDDRMLPVPTQGGEDRGAFTTPDEQATSAASLIPATSQAAEPIDDEEEETLESALGEPPAADAAADEPAT
jgi:hypothetical protein